MRRKRLRKRRSYRRLVYLALFLLMAGGIGIWASYGAAPTGTAEDGMAAGPVKKIMVVGIDPRENDAGRGDTLFLAMVDTKEKRGAILSIPPDTRAAIEGKGYDKINYAYALGGEVLTQQTVEELLGTPMDYYLIADLQTVAWAVDAIGGVDIDVEKRMYYEDPWEENGGLIIDLYPGRQHLDGARAMAYVRYRDDEGDIGRLGRQQKFLQAVLTKASSAEVIPRLPEVVEDMRKFLQTNMPRRDMVEMAQLLPTIREQGLTAEVLPGRPGRWEGNGYWLPNIEAARELLARQMGVAFTPAMKTAAENLSKQYQASLPHGLADVEGTLRLAAEVEAARAPKPQDVQVRVLNESGITGAAAAVAKELQEKGFTVVSVGNGDTTARQETAIMAPARAVDLFYGMTFPCIIISAEDGSQATVRVGRDFRR